MKTKYALYKNDYIKMQYGGSLCDIKLTEISLNKKTQNLNFTGEIKLSPFTWRISGHNNSE